MAGLTPTPPTGAPARAAPRARATPLRSRWRRWWDARLTRSDTHVLTQRTIYILPTGSGWLFGLLLVVLLLASINFQLSLGYGLTFLLAGSALMSIHLTHGTLRGLRLHLRPPQPGFAGDEIPLDVVVDNPGRARHGLWLGWRDEAGRPDAGVWLEVAAHDRHPVRLRQRARRRGPQPLPALVLSTRFPFGLFQAWTVWRPASTLPVWPRPEPTPPPLPAAAGAGTGMQGKAPAGAEFQGVRPWRHGDAPRQVVWKKAARLAATLVPDEPWDPMRLVSRDTTPPAGQSLWLDMASTGLRDADPEARLSRLAAWVLQADRCGLRAGLRLGGVTIAPDTGPVHRRVLLDALAAWVPAAQAAP